MLIDPVLESLGWNVRDWDEVQREYKVKPKDKSVRKFLSRKFLDLKPRL